MMLFRFLAMPLVALTLLIPGSHADAADLDRTDPKAVAAAFLTAFRDKDTATLVELSNETNRSLFEDVHQNGESSKAWSEVFGGWRYETAANWDGKTMDTRYRYRDGGPQALIGYAERGDEVAVVLLTKEGENWALEDINSPDKADLEMFPKTLD